LVGEKKRNGGKKISKRVFGKERRATRRRKATRGRGGGEKLKRGGRQYGPRRRTGSLHEQQSPTRNQIDAERKKRGKNRTGGPSVTQESQNCADTIRASGKNRKSFKDQQEKGGTREARTKGGGLFRGKSQGGATGARGEQRDSSVNFTREEGNVKMGKLCCFGGKPGLGDPPTETPGLNGQGTKRGPLRQKETKETTGEKLR